MINITEENLTDHVLNNLSHGDDERLKSIIQCLVKHSHAFVKETGLSHAEWQAGLSFLKEVVAWSDEKRDELILLSDFLGVSALVDLVSERNAGAGTATTGLGPFHIANQPFFQNDASILRAPVPGQKLWFKIYVTDISGAPIAGAELDVWQAHADGLYDLQESGGDNMRGQFKTDKNGYAGFTSVMPKGYPLPQDGPVYNSLEQLNTSNMRPAHIHVVVSALKFRKLVTHVFPRGDPYLKTDPVYGVRAGLLLSFEYIEKSTGTEPPQLSTPYWTAVFNIKLEDM